jgi:hypothetical protein
MNYFKIPKKSESHHKSSYKIDKPKLKIYDAFEVKDQADNLAKDLRDQGVQYVEVKRIAGQGGDSGRLKYGVFLGGKNSEMYVR